MEQWWNDTDGKLEYWEKNLSQHYLCTTDMTLGLTWDGTRTCVGKTNFSLNGS
jgi:hypothetical protein